MKGVLHMDRDLLVLLVEDDPSACMEFVEYIENKEGISLVSVTNNAHRATELIQNFSPDALILDLELHLGGGNGLQVLQELNQTDNAWKPYILVTTNNSSSVTHESARKLGADFIMSKHQAGYTPQEAVNFLFLIKDGIFRRRERLSIPKEMEAPEIQNKKISRKIIVELNRVGISTKAIGYQYLIDAILLAVKRPVPNICSQIGQKYGKSSASVERAMQNAIAKAWQTTPIEDLLQFYTAKINSEKGTPTITEFIYYYATKIKNSY